MNIYRLAIMFTRGGDWQTYFPWMAEEPPSPREVTQAMNTSGALRCWDRSVQGFAMGWITWDPEEVAAIQVTESYLILSPEDGYPCDPEDIEPPPLDVDLCPNCKHSVLRDGEPCHCCGLVIATRVPGPGQ